MKTKKEFQDWCHWHTSGYDYDDQIKHNQKLHDEIKGFDPELAAIMKKSFDAEAEWLSYLKTKMDLSKKIL